MIMFGNHIHVNISRILFIIQGKNNNNHYANFDVISGQSVKELVLRF